MATDSQRLNCNVVKELVQVFTANIQWLKSDETSEAVIRQEYIDPFWMALDWDVSNRQHRSRAEKDVLVEAPIKTIEE